ncbi:MAG TPA: condensation domain-containing protein [Solirubrobacterales bacterium]
MPCSFAQERIWRSSRTAEGLAGYTMASQMRIRGPLDVEALRAAIQHAVAVHEILRTTFVEREGRPLQLVGAPPEVEMPVIDIGGSQDPDSEGDRILHHYAREPFDLEAGPLLRLWLARVGDEDHRLLRLSHHIVTDWLSWRIFFTDVVRAYEAHRRGDPPPETSDGPQYADFAAWERERLRSDGPLYRDQLEWWRRAFEPGCPELEFPFSRPTPVPDAPETDSAIKWEMDPNDAAALDELARRADTTSFVVRLAVFCAQLGLSTGQEELALGTYAMNRPPGEAQSMFGFFSNPIMLILRFDQKLSFRRWLKRVQEVVTETKARSEIPYDRLCEELHRAGTPPPEMKAMFHRRGRWPRLESDGIELDAPRYTTTGMPWGFSFSVDAALQSEPCGVKFDARIHDPVAVRDFVERYSALVRRVVAKPNRRLRRLRP